MSPVLADLFLCQYLSIIPYKWHELVLQSYTIPTYTSQHFVDGITQGYAMSPVLADLF